MKKTLFILFTVLSVSVFSQTKLAIKLAPVIISNRVKNDSLTADSNGSVAKFSVGLVVDAPLSDTYYLSTGLIYMPKRAGFVIDTVAEEYRLQYLQIPLTVKLFTNEIAPDFKAFFQLGGGAEIKVFDERLKASYNIVKSFRPIDFSAILGAGAEYKLGINTTIFAGASYQRGLVDIVNEAVAPNKDLQIRNTVISIDLGMKF